MNANLIKKYIDFSRKFIKKAAKYIKSESNTIFNAGKSILKNVNSILNNLMSVVVKSKSPKAEALKTTLSGLLITAGGLYAGIQAHKAVNSFRETKDSSAIVQNSEKPNRIPSSKTNQILYSYNEKPQCEASHMPSYINSSQTWGSSYNTFALKGLRKISPPSIIVTVAGNAGNTEFFTRYNKTVASKEFDAILVGSLTPSGNPSTFSQTGRNKESSYRSPPAILAPSDHSITTTDDKGNYEKFGGTSGAAPLVTGALAGFTWLSGYQPTGAEVKVLLEKTAIPLSASHDKDRNGPGMLNAYKLGMVAKKLKEECGQDKYINCIKSKIQDPATYEFPEDLDILALVDKNFPECSANACFQKKESCENVGAIFQRLRKAAFLNPHKKEYWRYLSCIYASAGFAYNAKGMRNIYNGLLGAKYIKYNSRMRTEEFIDKSCQVDEDCIYVNSCPYDFKNKKYYPKHDHDEYHLKPANKDYVSECQGIAPCGDSCRCGSDKKKVVTKFPKDENNNYLKDKNGDYPTYKETYRLLCKNSQCVEEKEEMPDLNKENPPTSGGQR